MTSFSTIAPEATVVAVLVGAGLVDASVSACHQHRQLQNNELCFREVMHGRINMMIAVCPDCAHLKQIPVPLVATLCFRTEQVSTPEIQG